MRAVAPTVARVDKHRGVSRMNFLHEVADRFGHVDDREIVAFLDAEAFFLKQVRIGFGVGARLQ